MFGRKKQIATLQQQPQEEAKTTMNYTRDYFYNERESRTQARIAALEGQLKKLINAFDWDGWYEIRPVGSSKAQMLYADALGYGYDYQPRRYEVHEYMSTGEAIATFPNREAAVEYVESLGGEVVE